MHNPDNIWCSRDIESIDQFVKESCPINDISIIEKAKLDGWEQEIDNYASEWTSVELDEKHIIRYTKRANKLPISSWLVSYDKPCMDGSTRSENQYVTETNQLYNCDVELLSGIENDPRYTVQYESSEGKSF